MVFTFVHFRHLSGEYQGIAWIYNPPLGGRKRKIEIYRFVYSSQIWRRRTYRRCVRPQNRSEALHNKIQCSKSDWSKLKKQALLRFFPFSRFSMFSESVFETKSFFQLSSHSFWILITCFCVVLFFLQRPMKGKHCKAVSIEFKLINIWVRARLHRWVGARRSVTEQLSSWVNKILNSWDDAKMFHPPKCKKENAIKQPFPLISFCSLFLSNINRCLVTHGAIFSLHLFHTEKK